MWYIVFVNIIFICYCHFEMFELCLVSEGFSSYKSFLPILLRAVTIALFSVPLFLYQTNKQDMSQY